MKIFLFSVSIYLSATILIASLFFAGCNDQKSSDTEKNEEQSESESENLSEKITRSGKLNVGFEPDAPPLYFEESGLRKGFDYALITFISKELFGGAEIATIEDGYSQLPKLLQENKIDIMAGGRSVEENPDELYSDPYLSFGYCLIVSSASAKKHTDLKSLSRSRIGVYDDYAAQWVKSKIPSATITIIGDREDENTLNSDWMQGLVNGEFDAIVYDYPFASNEIVDYNDKIIITNRNLNGDDLNAYVLVLNKRVSGASDLMKKINSAIVKFKESPLYAESVVSYIPVGKEAETQPVVSGDTYTIKTGETLSIIARDHLGDVNKWNEIYNLNKKTLASPDIIYPGQKLVKPAGWR